MNFESISWLFAIPLGVALLGGLFMLNSRARRALVRKFASDRLVAQLLASYSPARRRLKNGLLLIAVAAVLLALARPQWGVTWRETKSKGIDIMFVVDVSRSMLARDIKPDRLERSKFAILDFLDKLEGDRVGLVAFAGNAFLQCPLTLDYDAFRQSLEAVDTNVISLGGTDIARAIDEAQAAFSDENNYKIMVLITDGEDLEEDGITRAQQATEDGVTIYTVGVGTQNGELIPIRNRFGQLEYLRDDDGEFVRTKLDADTLAKIAQTTDGFYTPLGPTGYGLEEVYEAGLEAVPEQELASRMQKVWLERFQWPLGLAILLLAWEPLIGTRRFTLRRKAKGPVVSPARSATVSKAAGWLLIACGLLAGASDLNASMRDGERYFQNGNYTAAAEEFQAALENDPDNAKAAFNLGNALQAQGEIDAAMAAYQRALMTSDLELQADAFYNMGLLKFQKGQEQLDGHDLEAIDQAAEQATQALNAALNQSEDILRRAEMGDFDETEAMQIFERAATAESAVEQSLAAAKEAQVSTEPADKLWTDAARDFKSSLELNPGGEDAAENFGFTSEFSESLTRQRRALSRKQSRLGDRQPALKKNVEDLRELLGLDEDQQGDSGKDSQDQQQSGEDQQSQGQSSDQQQSGESSDNEDQAQQDQSDQQEAEDAEQSESGDQEQESDSGDSESQQEGSDESSEEGEPQEGEGEPRFNEDQIDDMVDAMEEQGENDGEQTSPGQAGEQSSEEEGESMTVSEEEAARAAGEQATAATVQEGAEGQEGEGVPIGVMSREDARRLLESLKRSERKLPVSGYGRRESNRDDDGKRKDW